MKKILYILVSLITIYFIVLIHVSFLDGTHSISTSLICAGIISAIVIVIALAICGAVSEIKD